MTRPIKSLPLRIKTALVVGGGMVGLLAILLAVLSVYITERFSRLQLDLACQRIERVMSQLDQVAESMLSDAADNGTWDETYEFALGKRPGYLSRNYYDAPDAEEDYDFVMVFDRSRHFLGASTLDKTDVDTNGLRKGIDAAAIGASRIVGATDGGAGIFPSGAGDLLLASSPIRPTDGNAESVGTLVYGYFLEQSVLPKLEATTGIPMAPLPNNGNGVDPSVPFKVKSEYFGTANATFDMSRKDWLRFTDIRATLEIPTLNGGETALGITLQGDVFRNAIESRNAIFVSVALGGIVLVMLAVGLVELQVLRRLRALDQEFERLSREAPPGARVMVEGGDEFSRLAGSANRMLERIEAGRSELTHERGLLAGVFDATSEGVLALASSPDGAEHPIDFQIVRANAAAARLLSSATQALAGQKLSAIVPHTAESPLWGALLQAARTRAVQRVEVNEPRPDRWLEFSAECWQDGLVVTFSDITDRKKSEAQLRETLAEVEEFNAAMLGREERVLELKNEVNALRAKLKMEPRYGAGPDPA